MPSLKILCLHGTGSNVQILHSQLDPLMKTLQPSNTATFEFTEGQIQTAAGPGVAGFYDGPYYTFYNWPPTLDEEDEKSIHDAYEDLSNIIQEDGPFDGLLGFSQGGTLIAGFLAHSAKHRPPFEHSIRCAIFIGSLPPFRMDDNDRPIFDHEGIRGCISIPTLHVVGKKDFVHDYSLDLYKLCQPDLATLVMHGKGHEVPNDQKSLQSIARGFQELNTRVLLGSW